MGESTNPRAKLRFDRRVRLEFTVPLLPQTPDCWPVASWMMRWD